MSSLNFLWPLLVPCRHIFYFGTSWFDKTEMDNQQLFLVVVCSHNEFSLQLKMCAILAVAKLLKLISTFLKLIPSSLSLFLSIPRALLNKIPVGLQFLWLFAVQYLVCSLEKITNKIGYLGSYSWPRKKNKAFFPNFLVVSMAKNCSLKMSNFMCLLEIKVGRCVRERHLQSSKVNIYSQNIFFFN